MLGKTIVDFICSGYFVMALSADNLLYVWGALMRYDNGAVIGVGDGGTVARNYPVLATMTAFGNRTISKMSAGFSTAFVLTTDGTLFGLGDTTYFQVCHTSLY